MKFILVRHCETDWNREGRLQGHTNTNLSERGWIQADELARKLKKLEVRKIVSSDLKRSRETASAIKEYINVPVIYDARLRECNFGFLEGGKKNPDGLWHGSYFNYDFTKYGGESRDAVLRRHSSLLDELSQDNSPEPILLIGHGTGLNTLLAHLKKTRIQREEYQEIEYPG